MNLPEFGLNFTSLSEINRFSETRAMKFLRIVLGIMPWYSIELDIYVFHFIIAIQNEDLISLNLITIR